MNEKQNLLLTGSNTQSEGPLLMMSIITATVMVLIITAVMLLLAVSVSILMMMMPLVGIATLGRLAMGGAASLVAPGPQVTESIPPVLRILQISASIKSIVDIAPATCGAVGRVAVALGAAEVVHPGVVAALAVAISVITGGLHGQVMRNGQNRSRSGRKDDQGQKELHSCC